jgi:chaperonin GroES
MSTGIWPSGNRVVVQPDEVERVSEGGIIIPDADADKHQMAQSTGTLVGMGPDAFKEYTTVTERYLDGRWVPFERTVTGFSENFAEIGDRVAFAKYGGLSVIGEDGQEYRLMNDMDITGRVSDKVNFTDIHSRKRLSQG